jgi:hypothetical protein
MAKARSFRQFKTSPGMIGPLAMMDIGDPLLLRYVEDLLLECGWVTRMKRYGFLGAGPASEDWLSQIRQAKSPFRVSAGAGNFRRHVGV